MYSRYVRTLALILALFILSFTLAVLKQGRQSLHHSLIGITALQSEELPAKNKK